MEIKASRLVDILSKHYSELLNEWLEKQSGSLNRRMDVLSDAEIRKQSAEFLDILQEGLTKGLNHDLDAGGWGPMKEFLTRLSYSRAERGFSPSETASFIFSFKQPLFSFLKKELSDANDLSNETWTATELLDQLGLFTTEVYQKSRNAIIGRQQQELMELSTPVVRLWSGILALPLIGTLDSSRTQVVMENLLKTLVDTGSSIAIIDITGVPTVDTLVAQHLMKTVAAARLMGADCFISGIRPQIAQTIVHLGVTLPDVVTKGTLADAFSLALRRMGLKVSKVNGAE